MDVPTITIIILFGVIIYMVLFCLNFVNRLMFYKNRVIDKFSSIKNLINERAEIMSQVCEYLKVNCPHEDNIIKKLDELTIGLKSDNNINDLLTLLKKSREVLKNATNLEGTYIFLNNKEEYQNFKQLIKDNDGKIEFASSVYNEEVDNYSDFKSNKYILILSKLFKFPDYDHYE